MLAAVESAPGVRAAIPRMIINGLVSSATGNRMLFLQGIDPERETGPPGLLGGSGSRASTWTSRSGTTPSFWAPSSWRSSNWSWGTGWSSRPPSPMGR